jgi:hypothetical protein
LPARPRSDFGTGLPSPSVDGGRAELREERGRLPLQFRNPRILLGDPRVLLDDPGLQLGDDPLLRRHQRRQLVIRRRGHGPILHTPTMIIRSRHAART